MRASSPPKTTVEPENQVLMALDYWRMVYQARQTIRDQRNQTWQVIAFQPVQDSQMGHPYLRVVGFPGLTHDD